MENKQSNIEHKLVKEFIEKFLFSIVEKLDNPKEAEGTVTNNEISKLLQKSYEENRQCSAIKSYNVK